MFLVLENALYGIFYLPMSILIVLDINYPRRAKYCPRKLLIDDFTLRRQDLTASSSGLLVYIRSDFPDSRLKYAEVNCDGF